jgi:hypothetical protein
MNSQDGNSFEMRTDSRLAATESRLAATESRLAALEAKVDLLFELAREMREQIMKIRTTDFPILVGLIVSCNLATIGLLYKLLAP